MKRINRLLPYITSLLIFISILFVDFNHSMWHNKNRIIIWDIISYYEYLPATFIYNDITLKFAEEDHEKFHDKIWAMKLPNGNFVSKMSMGMAIMYSPFFFIAHLLSPILGYEADGYTVPYRFALQISAAIWLLAGLLLLSKLLLKYFKPWIASLTILSLVMATNLLYYTTIEAAMSHAYSFTLYVFFFYLSISYYDKSRLYKLILLGLLAGIITLIRPTNIIILLVFFLWGIHNVETLKQRFLYFLGKPQLIFLIILLIFLVWLPQFIYWKHVTGSWLYYSYGEERFFPGSPEIIKGLFSYRKGWLLYTPVMAFALAGIFLLSRKQKGMILPIGVFTVLNIYIIFSWWSWWYGGGFGQRPLIESYALLSLPLAAFIDYFAGKARAGRIAVITFVLLLNLHGIFMTMQYYYGSIHWFSMTKEAYWETFGKLRPTAEFYSMLDDPDTIQEVLDKKEN